MFAALIRRTVSRLVTIHFIVSIALPMSAPFQAVSFGTELRCSFEPAVTGSSHESDRVALHRDSGVTPLRALPGRDRTRAAALPSSSAHVGRLPEVRSSIGLTNVHTQTDDRTLIALRI